MSTPEQRREHTPSLRALPSRTAKGITENSTYLCLWDCENQSDQTDFLRGPKLEAFTLSLCPLQAHHTAS